MSDRFFGPIVFLVSDIMNVIFFKNVGTALQHTLLFLLCCIATCTPPGGLESAFNSKRKVTLRSP